MDQDMGKNCFRQGRRESCSKDANKSLKSSSKYESSSQQQPGKYLCVDTRKEQVYVPRVRPNSSYTHNFSTASTKLKHSIKPVHQNKPTQNLKTVQNRTVQPDSHCKFKTTLAIEYVQDLLEEKATNFCPTSRRNSLKKNGQLKPLIGAGQLTLEPNVTKCLGIQNDRRKKTVTLEDGLEVREEVLSPGLTRFSSALAKNVSPNTLTVDLRKLSLVDQSYSETVASGYSSSYEENPGINQKNWDHSKSTDIRRWSSSSHDHAIDDIDNGENIDDTIDYNYAYGDRVLDLGNRQLDYNRSDSDGSDCNDVIRDDCLINNQENTGNIDHIVSRNNHISDDLFEESSVSHQSHQSHKDLKKSDGFQVEDIFDNKSRKGDLDPKTAKSKRKLIYYNRKLMNADKKNLRMNDEPRSRSPDEKISELANREEIACSDRNLLMGENFDYTGSTNRLQLDTSANIGSGSIAKSSRPRPKVRPGITQENTLNTSHLVNAHSFKEDADLQNRLNLEDDLLHLNKSSRTADDIPGIYDESRLKNLSKDFPDIGPKSCRKVSDNEMVPQNASSSSLFSSSNSTMPLFKPSISEQDRQINDENEGVELDPEFDPNSLDNDRPQQSTSAKALSSSTNSTTPSLKPNIPGLDCKTQGIYDRSSLKKPDRQEQVESLSSCSNSTLHSLKPSTPDQDSIQVKDIWKALVDGGVDISRKEVSEYKINSSKPRVKSAPARRRSTQSNTFVNEVPTRAKSAMNKDCKEKLRKECFGDRNEEVDSEKIMKKNLNVGGFFVERPSETKLKPNQDSSYNDQNNLEVVAVSKPMTKLLRKKNIPLIPPLNFQINTIPKSGHFFYFAYGLNMNQKRLEIQLRCQTGVRYWGLLFSFRLLFNKRGSTEGGVGFPNIIHEPGFSVEGCVYELPLDCLPLLDTCVGFPKHYSRLVLPVWLCNSLQPDEHGVAQHCVPAVVYVAQNDWVALDPTTLDTSFTLKQCILGTDMLTPNYQQFLDTFNQRTVLDGSMKS